MWTTAGLPLRRACEKAQTAVRRGVSSKSYGHTGTPSGSGQKFGEKGCGKVERERSPSGQAHSKSSITVYTAWPSRRQLRLDISSISSEYKTDRLRLLCLILRACIITG
jgi:hypothetical protein